MSEIQKIVYGHVSDYLSINKKLVDFDKEDLHGVFYTDGGCVNYNNTIAGWGCHGYVYHNSETKSNSKNKKAIATENGYSNGKDLEKKPVISYIDYHGYLVEDKTTNNRAELMGLMKCLWLIGELPIKTALIKADSKYVITILEGKDKYRENGFKASSGNEMANKDLVLMLYAVHDAVEKLKPIRIEWVAGHSGDFGNDRADDLATRGIFRLNNSLSNVKELEHLHEECSLRICNPDEYFESDSSAAKMLSESHLFFTNNGMDSDREDTIYFQASFGSELGSKSGNDKKALFGKPFSDICMSVVALKKPDEVTNKLMKIISENLTDTGVIEINLSHLSRNAIYSEMVNTGFDNFLVDRNKNKLILTNKTELASLLHPTRLAFRLIDDFNIVHHALLSIMSNQLIEFDNIIDITGLFYEIGIDKKNNRTYKPHSKESAIVNVELDINLPELKKSISIPLVVGVDLPSRITLGRFKSINPTIKLFTWETTTRSLRYGIIIETDEGIGVWMSIYSNTVLI